MRTKLSFLFIVCLVLAGCRKDSNNSKPALTIEDIRIFQGSCDGSVGIFLEIDINVRDKEGDVKDTIFIQKVDAGIKPCPDNSILKNLNYKIPDFPISNTQNILFRLKFTTRQCQGYTLIGGAQCLPRKDTSIFKIWVRDLGGNISDTLTTSPIAFP